MTIQCTPKEEMILKEHLRDFCPFNKSPLDCHNGKDCDTCMAENIEFKIENAEA